MSQWWSIKRKSGGPRIFWKHEPKDPPAHEQARKVIQACMVSTAHKMEPVNYPPKLISIGIREGVECFVEASL